MKHCKIVSIGDEGVGKTNIFFACSRGSGYISNNTDFVPSIQDHRYNVVVDNLTYTVSLWDTAGEQEHDKLRPLGYPNTDVFLICFDVSTRSSYDNVELRWLPEVKRYAPNIAVILVGNKLDLRETRQITRDVISHEEGQALAAKLGIPTYLECSALTQEGIPSIIPTALRTAFSGPKSGRKSYRFWFQRRRKMQFANTSKIETNKSQPQVIASGQRSWLKTKCCFCCGY